MSAATGIEKHSVSMPVSTSEGVRARASAITLAEVTDGTARDARVRRAAKALRVEEATAEIGHDAGRLRAGAASPRRKARDMTVDAVVAATALALRGPVVVLTADDGDLDLLLDGTPVKVERVGKT
jgi:predicted nucleic acid-binding protein